MRLSLPKLLPLPLLALFWLSCDQDLNSSADQPLVDYILYVTDSSTAAPLDSVRVRVTAINGDTSLHFTEASGGRLALPSLPSSRTVFELGRRGYRDTSFIDTVSGPADTTFPRRPLTRILRFKLVRLGSDSARRVQTTLSFRNPDLDKLRQGKVSFTDSLGSERTVVDEDGNGVVELSGLKPGDNQVLVEHAGYLGRLITVRIGRLSDSAGIAPGNTLTLLPMSGSLSGQVNYLTAAGPKGLPDAKVVFLLKDSLSVPNRIPGPDLALSLTDKDGRFEIRNVPAVEGELRYYRNKAANEHLAVKPLTAEEVLRDGPLPAVTLTLPLDSLAAVVDTVPKDTVNPRDTLVFHFTQPVERYKDAVVRLINASQRILTETRLDEGKRRLRVAPSQEDWQAGKTYAYELEAVNGQGQGFTRRGDTSILIRGTFSVREKAALDTNLVLPEAVRITGFNSGIDPRFDSSAAESSPLGDSTTRFARLKWNWPKTGKRVDSVLVFVKDGLGNANWSQLQGFPGFLDSASLDFAYLYSTVSKKNGNPVFPLLVSPTQEIQVQVRFFEDGRLLAKEVDLPSVKQGMGPSVYVWFDTAGTVRRGVLETDTLFVSFRKVLGDASTAVDFGADAPKPRLYAGDVADSLNLVWEWKDGKTGRLIYKITESMGVRPLLRVDASNIRIDGMPVWQRNRKTGFGLY